MTKKNYNIGIINDMFIKSVKHAFGASYAAISLMADISSGILKPFVTMLSDPNILNKFKAAAEVAKTQQHREFLELASKGELDFSIITDSTGLFENATIIIKDLIKPGGFRKFLKAVTTEEQFASISTTLDRYSGKPFPKDFVEEIQAFMSLLTMESLYSATLFNADSNFVLYPNGVKIDKNTKLVDLLDSLKVPELSGEQIINDTTMFVNNMLDILSVAKNAVGPFYDVTLPFINACKNIFNAFTEKGATIVSAAEAVFRLGKSYLEFYNTCQNVKVVDTPKEFIDLEYIFMKFFENVNVTFEKTPESFIDFTQTLFQLLNEDIHLVASKYFVSLKGSAFYDNIFTILRQMSESDSLTYKQITNFLSAAGQYLLVNNTLQDIEARVDAIAVTLCSDNGEVRELAKSIFKCDIVGIAADYSILMDLTLGARISVQDLAVTAVDLQKNLKQAERVEEEYNSEAGVDPSVNPYSMPAWGIALICIVAIIVVGVIIAFAVICIRRRDKKDFMQV